MLNQLRKYGKYTGDNVWLLEKFFRSDLWNLQGKSKATTTQNNQKQFKATSAWEQVNSDEDMIYNLGNMVNPLETMSGFWKFSKSDLCNL